MLCQKNVVVSGVIVTAGVVFGFAGTSVQPNILTPQHSLTWAPTPWLGALSVEGDYKISAQGLVLVVMISDKIGIADAKSMSELNKYKWEDIRNTTQVLFLTKTSQAWYAQVEKFVLHPDFNDETLTTMALLHLEYDLSKFEGTMLTWPFKFKNTSHTDGELFAIGYTNRNTILEQTVYRMEYVILSQCQNFYILEALDTKWMRPKQYHCYKMRFSTTSCVFEPGMALVHYAEGKYTLMGLSVWGPGCSLPARFFDFEPFVPWIMSKMQTRRMLWGSDSMPEEALAPKAHDRWMLERIYDFKGLVLRPITIIKEQPVKEIVHGTCDGDNMENKMLVYREVQEYKTREGLDNRSIKAVAIYSLSLYDTKFYPTNYTCIQILAKCKQKSDSKLEYQISHETNPIDPYVRYVPHTHATYRDYFKPLLPTIMGKYEIIGPESTHLIFSFEFEKEANIEILFYGIRKTTTAPTRTTRRTFWWQHIRYCTRHRRPYKTNTWHPHRPYWYYTWKWYGKVGYTTRSRPYRRRTPKKRTTKKPRGTRGTTVSKYWWNKWWQINTDPPQDWWKG